MSNFFYYILIKPIFNVLIAIYTGLVALHVPYALGFSIIGLTIVMRLILYPLTASQLRTSRKMQLLTPHLTVLKEKHKNDAQKLQAETMALYRQHGVNPAAGCLPVIIQLPLIWSLYFVLQHVVGYKLSDINHQIYFSALTLHHIWDTNFFGLSLGQSPSKLIAHVGMGILMIPVITGVLQFIQTKMMMPPVAQKTIVQKDKKKDDTADFAAAFQSQSLYVFPVMIGFFSYTFPMGLSLYWNTFTIFGIIQQYQLAGLGGLESLFRKTPQQEVINLMPSIESRQPKKGKKKH